MSRHWKDDLGNDFGKNPFSLYDTKRGWVKATEDIVRAASQLRLKLARYCNLGAFDTEARWCVAAFIRRPGYTRQEEKAMWRALARGKPEKAGSKAGRKRVVTSVKQKRGTK